MWTVVPIVLWAHTLAGSPWTNLGHANCSAASYAFSAISANRTSQVLWTSFNSSASPLIEGVPSQVLFELELWTFMGDTLALGRFAVDGVVEANRSITLPTSRSAGLVLPWSALPRERIELRVDALPGKSGIALFACARLRALFPNATTTATTIPTPEPLPGSPLEEATPAGTDSTGAWAEAMLMVAFGLFFLGSLLLPTGGGGRRWQLKNRVPAARGFFFAWLRHKGDEWVYVAGFQRPSVPSAPPLRGREFCPFLGARDGVHLYATGERDLLDARGATLERRLAWAAAASRATAAAHAEGLSIGELSSLWVDPATQELAVADYYCYAPGPRAAAGDMGRLGQLASDLLRPDCSDDEVMHLIDSCLDTLDDLTRPTAAECAAVFDQCRRRLLSSTA
jgi:hypothetical protein